MAASPKLAPQMEVVWEKKTPSAGEPKPSSPKQRFQNLLIEIFKGHTDFLGWTPQ